jgi:adenine-specific DNA-methyltransferase
MRSNERRHAVAAAIIRDDGLVLAVRRPDEPGEELPGVWGLPATTLRTGESPEEALRRLGREKLGVELTPLRALAGGEQQRPGYTLRMTVYGASMDGEATLPTRDPNAGTLYDAVDWLPAESFREAAEQGSLCCRLYLSTLTPNPSPASGRGELARQGWRPKEWISPEVRQRMVAAARGFRQVPTRSEAILWQAIRDRKLDGLKFRRQHPVGPYVADFCCAEARLIVEVDGPVHDSHQQRDRDRQQLLEAAGYRVLRIPSEDIERDVRPVLAKIRAVAEELNP